MPSSMCVNQCEPSWKSIFGNQAIETYKKRCEWKRKNIKIKSQPIRGKLKKRFYVFMFIYFSVNPLPDDEIVYTIQYTLYSIQTSFLEICIRPFEWNLSLNWFCFATFIVVFNTISASHFRWIQSDCNLFLH